MSEELLPIGTVVILKGGSKKIMINGYYVMTDAKKGKIFDYRGCPFPEGIIISEGTALFDHNQISEVCHMGYRNDESINFLDKIQMIKEDKEANN